MSLQTKINELVAVAVDGLDNAARERLEYEVEQEVAALTKTKAEQFGYSDYEAAEIGGKLAAIFVMRRSREHKDRWLMTTGDKTDLGLFRTFIRLAHDIEHHRRIDV